MPALGHNPPRLPGADSGLYLITFLLVRLAAIETEWLLLDVRFRSIEDAWKRMERHKKFEMLLRSAAKIRLCISERRHGKETCPRICDGTSYARFSNRAARWKL
jgi:hypothetical protein